MICYKYVAMPLVRRSSSITLRRACKKLQSILFYPIYFSEKTRNTKECIFISGNERKLKKKKRRSTLLSSVVHGKANHLRKKNSKPQHFRPCGVSLTRQGMVQREWSPASPHLRTSPAPGISDPLGGLEHPTARSAGKCFFPRSEVWEQGWVR